MYHREFDREFDAALKMEERQRNGDSKVSLSFERFRRVQEENSDEDDDGEIEPEFGPECRSVVCKFLCKCKVISLIFKIISGIGMH